MARQERPASNWEARQFYRASLSLSRDARREGEGGMSPISSALWTRTRQSLERPTSAHEGIHAIPLGLRIAALVLRAVFIGILIVLVARVSSPQSETIWSAY